MNPGTVAVDASGVVTGGGIALILYNAISVVQEAANPLPNPTLPDADWGDSPAAWAALANKIGVGAKQGWAREAQAHANALAVRKVVRVTADRACTIDDDLVSVGTRAAGVTITLPASAPVGTYVDVHDESSEAVAKNITIAAPGGETATGTTVLNLADGTLHAVKITSTVWRVWK